MRSIIASGVLLAVWLAPLAAAAGETDPESPAGACAECDEECAVSEPSRDLAVEHLEEALALLSGSQRFRQVALELKDRTTNSPYIEVGSEEAEIFTKSKGQAGKRRMTKIEWVALNMEDDEEWTIQPAATKSGKTCGPTDLLLDGGAGKIPSATGKNYLRTKVPKEPSGTVSDWCYDVKVEYLDANGDPQQLELDPVVIIRKEN